MTQHPTPTSAAARLLAGVRSADPHLTYVEIEAQVDGTLDSTIRARVDAHLERCAQCARERTDFATFAVAMTAPIQAVGRTPPRSIASWLSALFDLRLVGAFAALLVALVGLTMLGAVDIGPGPLDWLRRSPTVSAPVATPADKPASDLRLPETPIADETLAMLSPAAREALRSGNAGPAIKELRALALTGRTDAAAALQQLDEHPTGNDGK